jgi:hypothetical protein
MLCQVGSLWIFEPKIKLPAWADVYLVTDPRVGDLSQSSTIRLDEVIMVLDDLIIVHVKIEFIRVLHVKPGWMCLRHIDLFERLV